MAQRSQSVSHSKGNAYNEDSGAGVYDKPYVCPDVSFEMYVDIVLSKLVLYAEEVIDFKELKGRPSMMIMSLLNMMSAIQSISPRNRKNKLNNAKLEKPN